VRRASYVILAVLGLLVAATLLLLSHPVLLTGRYYEVTVRSVEHGPHGLVTMTYDETLTYGTRVSWVHSAAHGTGSNTYGWRNAGRRFPTWPRTEQERTYAQFLSTEEERAKGLGDDPAFRRRWVCEPGVHRLRPGELLVLARWQYPDGRFFQSTIEVSPEP
jgi:hypothetical protein